MIVSGQADRNGRHPTCPVVLSVAYLTTASPGRYVASLMLVPFTAALVWLVERQWAFRLGTVGDDVAADGEIA